MEEKMGTILADTLYSKEMRIDWNYSVYLPNDYQKGTTDVWFLLHGANGHQLNLLERIDLKEHLDKMNATDVFVFVDGFNSFYIDGPGISMESAILKDLIPHIEKLYEPQQKHIAGISMGGHGALRLALKYPNMFKNVGALSPAVWYEMNESIYTYSWHVFRDENGEYLHGKWNEAHPSSYLENASAIQSRFFVMTGQKDEAVSSTNVEKLAHSMIDKGLDVKWILDEKGDHSWPFWDKAIMEMLKYFQEKSKL